MSIVPLLLLLAPAPLPQEAPAPEATQTPLPEGVVARLDDRYITREEYLDYLWFRFGKRAVRDLATRLLVEREAERYGIRVDETEVQRRVAERVEAAWNSPRPVPFEEEIRRNGQSLEMFRATVAAEIRQDLLLDALVRATRVVTDDRLQQAFDRKYGPGGVLVRVRHILLMPNVLRAQAIRQGRKPNEVDMEEMRRQARETAEAARQRILAGEEFGDVCLEVSHDQVTRQKGGVLANYDGRLYGPAFRAAVEALEKPGDVSEVVESGAGFHVIQLVDRTVTRLEEVREQLLREILEAEPTWQEKQAVVQALQGRADLQLW